MYFTHDGNSFRLVHDTFLIYFTLLVIIFFFYITMFISISSGYEKWSSKLLCSGVSTPQFGVYKIIPLVLSFYLENQLTQLKTFFYLLSCSNKIVW